VDRFRTSPTSRFGVRNFDRHSSRGRFRFDRQLIASLRGEARRAPTVCKIYHRGDFYFAIAGLEHDAGRGFYVKDLVANAVN
jgi:hypothetical protein